MEEASQDLEVGIEAHLEGGNSDDSSTFFGNFTAKALVVISLAQQEARYLSNDSLGTEHIFLGLIAEGTDKAAKILRLIGINLKNARIEVIKTVGKGSATAIPELIPFTPRCRELLELAVEQANQLNQDYVGTEHLLLGLLAMEECAGIKVVKNFGISLEEIRKHIFDQLHRASLRHH